MNNIEKQREAELHGRYKTIIKYLVGELRLAPTQRELGVLLGYNEDGSSFSQVISGPAKIPKNLNKKLKNLWPDLNVDWLETGKGSMSLTGNQTVENSPNTNFVGNNATNVQQNASSVIEKAFDEIAEHRRLIERHLEELSEQRKASNEQINLLIEIIEKNIKK